MEKTTLSVILLLFFFACEKDEPSTVAKQQWFKDMKVPCDENSICKTSIQMARYQGTTVYFSSLYGGYCDPSFYVRLYNENGEVVKEYDEDNVFDFYSEVTGVMTIWKCDNWF